MQRFVQLAASNPDLALNVSTQDLTQTLTIAAQLFNRSELTAEEGILFLLNLCKHTGENISCAN